MKSDLTQDRLKELLHYDPESGHFTWRTTRLPRAIKGSRAGTDHKLGYRFLGVDYHTYKEHRLAWLYMTGEWPDRNIDHINGVKDDNRWLNLREASQAQNVRNSSLRSDNKTGVKGVCWSDRYSAYIAQIQTDGKHQVLGKFPTLEEAKRVVDGARARQHGAFARYS